MAIKILNTGAASASVLYTELCLDIDVTERSWSSSDPFDEVVLGVANKLEGLVFNDYKLKSLITGSGYTVQNIKAEMVDGGPVFRKQNGAFSSKVVGYTVEIAEKLTPAKAKKLASVIFNDFPLEVKSYPLEGIIVDGYPLIKSDLDEQNAEVDCRIIALSITSNGKNVYFS